MDERLAPNFADADGGARSSVRERAQLEERSVRSLLQRAHTLEMTVAIENVAAGPSLVAALQRAAARR